jgi:hypothetical protein
MPPGEQSRDVPAGVAGHDDEDEHDDPARSVERGEQEQGEPGQEGDVGGGEHGRGHVRDGTLDALEDPEQQDAEGSERERDQEPLLAPHVGRDQHAEGPDSQRYHRNLDVLDQEDARQLPDRHHHGDRDQPDECLLAGEQRGQDRSRQQQAHRDRGRQVASGPLRNLLGAGARSGRSPGHGGRHAWGLGQHAVQRHRLGASHGGEHITIGAWDCLLRRRRMPLTGAGRTPRPTCGRSFFEVDERGAGAGEARAGFGGSRPDLGVVRRAVIAARLVRLR